MNYNDEQRALIHRIGEISARFDTAAEQARVAQVRATQDAINALATAMNSLREIVALNREHGDAFREFLDTL